MAGPFGRWVRERDVVASSGLEPCMLQECMLHLPDLKLWLVRARSIVGFPHTARVRMTPEYYWLVLIVWVSKNLV